jgi:hypothetical protein
MARSHSTTSHPADLHPVADYKCFNSSNVSIRPWSWNYRSCWHQTCPPVVTHHRVWIASITSPASTPASWIVAVRRCLTRCFCIGQFARLLPTLVVVAISQAPSPESNPNSPLPVIATVVHYTTVKADRSEVRVIKQAVVIRPQYLPTRLSQRDQPESSETAAMFQALVFIAAGCNPPRSTSWMLANTNVADVIERVLATRFWRMSKWAPGTGACHTLSRR